MAFVLTSRPSKKSKLKRISFLPRIGITLDVAGKQYGYFQVPLTETLLNMQGRPWSLKSLIATAHLQIKELELPNKSPKKKTPKKPSSRRKKS